MLCPNAGTHWVWVLLYGCGPPQSGFPALTDRLVCSVPSNRHVVPSPINTTTICSFLSSFYFAIFLLNFLFFLSIIIYHNQINCYLSTFGHLLPKKKTFGHLCFQYTSWAKDFNYTCFATRWYESRFHFFFDCPFYVKFATHVIFMILLSSYFRVPDAQNLIEPCTYWWRRKHRSI